MDEDLRIAFFPDTYHEINGAAMTCRRLVEYAGSKNSPLLCVHAGRVTELVKDRSVTYLSLRRSKLAIKVDEELAYDPLFQRHVSRARKALLDFRPSVVHITGLNDVGIIGAYLAWQLGLPLLGSWHTNLHEFAASRINRKLGFLPQKIVKPIANIVKEQIMNGSVLYYRIPGVILAPNQDLVDELSRRTGRHTQIMQRGVDTSLFSPDKRTANDGIFRIGFVGRLRPEKNVELLIDLERALFDAGRSGFRFLIVGEGSERRRLESKMRSAEFTGFLKYEQLAESYANMDVFVFPSETETFGNVCLEANASGVPAIVTGKGGPKYIVDHGRTGFIARDQSEFINSCLMLLDDRELLNKMRVDARSRSLDYSWDATFAAVYDGYRTAIRLATKIE